MSEIKSPDEKRPSTDYGNDTRIADPNITFGFEEDGQTFDNSSTRLTFLKQLEHDVDSTGIMSEFEMKAILDQVKSIKERIKRRTPSYDSSTHDSKDPNQC